jgi:hypothetical protein
MTRQLESIMAHSSLLGIDRTPANPPGRDVSALGPSDTSDSGSDVANLAEMADGDPGLPVDVAVGEDGARASTPNETIASGGDSDAPGTGERRSAAADAGLREASDISPDRIVDMNNRPVDEEAGPDDLVELAADDGGDDEEEDEEEDEEDEGDDNRPQAVR